MNKNSVEWLSIIAEGTPGSVVLYDQSKSTTTTYEEGVDWDSTLRPRFFDVNNVGASAVSVAITNAYGTTITMTVDATTPVGAISISPHIAKIIVTASDNYRLLVRR